MSITADTLREVKSTDDLFKLHTAAGIDLPVQVLVPLAWLHIVFAGHSTSDLREGVNYGASGYRGVEYTPWLLDDIIVCQHKIFPMSSSVGRKTQ